MHLSIQSSSNRSTMKQLQIFVHLEVVALIFKLIQNFEHCNKRNENPSYAAKGADYECTPNCGSPLSTALSSATSTLSISINMGT